MGHFGSESEISSFSIMSKLRTGDTDFINPTLTSLVNLALTVGVIIPISREIPEMICGHHLIVIL